MEKLGYMVSDDGVTEYRNNSGLPERRFLYGSNPGKWESVSNGPLTCTELKAECEAGNFRYRPPKPERYRWDNSTGTLYEFDRDADAYFFAARYPGYNKKQTILRYEAIGL